MSAFQPSIKRRESTKIYVGNVPVGGDAPIAVQSMTNTRTTDVEATVAQIKSLERVGADIVRVSVPTMDAAEAFKQIKQQVNVPLVADIHFDYRIALKVAEYGVDCLRINPGNIGREDRIRAVVDCARDKNIPIRIGVNAGSLEKDLQEKYGEPTPEALLESALRHVEILDRLNFDQFKVSVKASDVFLAVEAYRLLAKSIKQPLHLGITEAGGARAGAVKSAIGLGMLLAFMLPHLFAFLLAVILNIICSFKNANSRILMIVTLIFYIISGVLGGIFLPFVYATVVIQVILLILAVIQYKKSNLK